MKSVFGQKRNGLILMYVAAVLFSSLVTISILVSDHMHIQSFALIVIVGGMIWFLAKLSHMSPIWGGVLSILFSTPLVLTGFLGISTILDSPEMLFYNLANLTGGLLIYIGALVIIWSTRQIKPTS